MMNKMKEIPNDARCEALEISVDNLETKIKSMTEQIHYFRYEMAKYFRKYNKLEHELEVSCIQNIASNVQVLIKKEADFSISESDFAKSLKETISKWFNEQMQELVAQSSPVLERMDKIEQNFLDYIRYFEEQKGVNILKIE